MFLWKSSAFLRKKLVLPNKTFKLAEMTQGVAISKVVG